MSKVTIEDVLSNQPMLWERYTRKDPRPDGGVYAVLAEGLMPDGRLCSATLWGTKLQIVQKWYDYVRGEYDARKAKQEAAAASRAEPPAASGGPEAGPARVNGGGDVTVAQAVPKREATLEEILQAEIVKCGGRIAGLKEEISSAEELLERLRAGLSRAESERSKAIRAAKAMAAGGEACD